MKAAHKGAEQPRIWLGMAVPGDTVGNYGVALALLSEQATFLYSEGTRYWYAAQASIARMARERADRLKERPDEAWEEILRRLRSKEASARGMFARVQIGPEKSDDIPDEQAVRLVIMHPQFRHTRGDMASSAAVWAKSAAEGRGSAHRMNRNMVVFLAADSRDYEILDEAARQYLAWEYLAGSEERIRDLDLPPQQAAQARKRLKDADDTVWTRLSRAYVWLLVPAQSVGGGGLVLDVQKADTAKERLAERASDKLRNADLLRAVQGPQNIRLNLEQYLSSVWSAGHIAVGQLWEYYCRYPYLPRLAERSVLDHGIAAVFDQVVGRTTASPWPRRTTRPRGGMWAWPCQPRTSARPSPTRRCWSTHRVRWPSGRPNGPKPRPRGPQRWRRRPPPRLQRPRPQAPLQPFPVRLPRQRRRLVSARRW